MEKRCTWDNGSVWLKDRPCKMYVGQWPIFHGPLILPYIIVRLKLFLYIKKWHRLGVFVPLRALALVFKAKENELCHEIMVFVLRQLILQTRMCSHPMGLDVWFLVRPFIFFHTLCVRTAKALARLCRCAGPHESLLVAYVISTIISWAASNEDFHVCTEIWTWFSNWEFLVRNWERRYFLALGMCPYFDPKWSRKGTLQNKAEFTCPEILQRFPCLNEEMF